jgi:hypothetical protein
MSDLDALLAQVEALDLDDPRVAGVADTAIGPVHVFKSSADWESWANEHLTRVWAELGISPK